MSSIETESERKNIQLNCVCSVHIEVEKIILIEN